MQLFLKKVLQVWTEIDLHIVQAFGRRGLLWQREGGGGGDRAGAQGVWRKDQEVHSKTSVSATILVLHFVLFANQGGLVRHLQAVEQPHAPGRRGGRPGGDAWQPRAGLPRPVPRPLAARRQKGRGAHTAGRGREVPGWFF